MHRSRSGSFHLPPLAFIVGAGLLVVAGCGADATSGAGSEVTVTVSVPVATVTVTPSPGADTVVAAQDATGAPTPPAATAPPAPVDHCAEPGLPSRDAYDLALERCRGSWAVAEAKLGDGGLFFHHYVDGQWVNLGSFGFYGKFWCRSHLEDAGVPADIIGDIQGCISHVSQF